jgi:hypothetical protein
MDLSDRIDQISQRCLSEGFDKLSPAERVVWLISWADFEINLGGGIGYLYNSAGNHLPELTRALETLGCTKMARVAARLNAALARSCNDVRDRVARFEAMRELEKNEGFGALLDEFTNSVQGQLENYGDALERYVLAHWGEPDTG